MVARKAIAQSFVMLSCDYCGASVATEKQKASRQNDSILLATSSYSVETLCFWW
ncbi:hypothetical protein [Nostoc sp. CCY0012]|uniref:hypothetical protein n=1 Tax=Nostoc sp. CCY0012 TaxID=1056123 RepID=UPI0039C6D183